MTKRRDNSMYIHEYFNMWKKSLYIYTYTFQDLMSQFNCVVPFIPPISRYNHHDICLNKTEDEIEKIMTLFVKSASNTTQGTPIIFAKITLAYSQVL